MEENNLRSNEEVIRDAMSALNDDNTVVEVVQPEESIGLKEVLGEDNNVSEKEVKQHSPSKRRHAGELQRLRMAHEQAEQIAMQKAAEVEILRQELQAQKAYNSELINHAQELKSDYAEGILKQSEKELKDALEHGDADSITNILSKQREINKIVAKDMAEKAIRENLPQYQEQTYVPSSYDYEPNYNTPSVNPHYYAWLDKTDNKGNRINAWADPEDTVNYSPELVEEALEYAYELNKLLKKKSLGDVIGTEDYYDIISQALDAKHGIGSTNTSDNYSEETYTENQPRESSRPISYAPVSRGGVVSGSYITPKQGSKYTISPDIAKFINNLPFVNENMSEKEKYNIFLKFYDEEQSKINQKRK